MEYQPLRNVRLTNPANNDIAKALRRSEQDFGPAARHRYRYLVDQAIKDLDTDSDRIGVRSLQGIREGYFSYHLKSSIPNMGTPRVRHPRHLIVFYLDVHDDIVVARVLHERQMLSHYL